MAVVGKRTLARMVARHLPWATRQQLERIIELLCNNIARGVILDGEVTLEGFGRFFQHPHPVSFTLEKGTRKSVRRSQTAMVRRVGFQVALDFKRQLALSFGPWLSAHDDVCFDLDLTELHLPAPASDE